MSAVPPPRERLSAARALGYALGGAGFQITDRVVIAVAVYFYLPPPESGLVPLLPGGIWLGGLTAYGLARLAGGAIDSLADPFVGWASDRSRSRLGRRRMFLAAGVVPMCWIPLLLFYPPGEPGSALNFAALAVTLCLYYVFFTVYVAPYLALLPELARDARERARLATLMAGFAAPIAGGYGALWLAGVGLAKGAGWATADAIRVVVAASCALSFALCLAPLPSVDESRFAKPEPSTLPLREALLRTLRDRAFLLYLAAQVLFILGITMIQPVLPYYSVVVLGRDEAFGAYLAAALFPGMLVGFLLVNLAARRFGPRLALAACTLLLGLCLGALGLLRPDLPGGPRDAANQALLFGAMALAGVPVAGFLVLPHVVIGQLIDRDEVRGGVNRSAMYFGVQGLLTKWVYAASLALLSFLFARYGNGREEPLGVLLVGPVAGVLCGISAILYLAYPERRILQEARERQEPG
jgi:GPH family glycoside/pentoside/hexuronide:cation symporter